MYANYHVIKLIIHVLIMTTDMNKYSSEARELCEGIQSGDIFFGERITSNNNMDELTDYLRQNAIESRVMISVTTETYNSYADETITKKNSKKTHKYYYIKNLVYTIAIKDCHRSFEINVNGKKLATCPHFSECINMHPAKFYNSKSLVNVIVFHMKYNPSLITSFMTVINQYYNEPTESNYLKHKLRIVNRAHCLINNVLRASDSQLTNERSMAIIAKSFNDDDRKPCDKYDELPTFYKLYETHRQTDYSLTFNDDFDLWFSVHRIILMTNSEYFNSLLCTNYIVSSHNIDLDIKIPKRELNEVIIMTIKYMYTQKMPSDVALWTYLNEFAVIAKKLKIPALIQKIKELCEEIIPNLESIKLDASYYHNINNSLSISKKRQLTEKNENITVESSALNEESNKKLRT